MIHTKQQWTLESLRRIRPHCPNTGPLWSPLPHATLLDTLIAMLADRVEAKGGRAAQLGIRVV